MFAKTPDDEKVSLSIHDREFLAIMEEGYVRDENGNWIAPFHFEKTDRVSRTISCRPYKEQDIFREVS